MRHNINIASQIAVLPIGARLFLPRQEGEET